MITMSVNIDTETPSRTFGNLLVDGVETKTMDLAELAMFFGELHSAAQRLDDCAKFVGGADAD